jgi:hypothetical protein
MPNIPKDLSRKLRAAASDSQAASPRKRLATEGMLGRHLDCPVFVFSSVEAIARTPTGARGDRVAGALGLLARLTRLHRLVRRRRLTIETATTQWRDAERPARTARLAAFKR